MDEFILDALKQGYLPSFCTACYRQGRTGEAFMDLAKPGEIQNLCRPNALLTFQEYLEDYASPPIKKMGQKIIQRYLAEISSPQLRAQTAKKLEKIKRGKRDIYF